MAIKTMAELKEIFKGVSSFRWANTVQTSIASASWEYEFPIATDSFKRAAPAFEDSNGRIAQSSQSIDGAGDLDIDRRSLGDKGEPNVIVKTQETIPRGRWTGVRCCIDIRVLTRVAAPVIRIGKMYGGNAFVIDGLGDKDVTKKHC